MASLRQKPNSRFWIACFSLPDGGRAQRSTKTTDRKAAQKMADTFEDAAQRRLSARQAQRVITEIFQRATGDPLSVVTTRAYFKSWLARKKSETASTTYSFYSGKAFRFLGWLGDRADRELFGVTPNEILAFRASEAERVSPSTVNHEIKFLRMVFGDAKRDGVLADSPVENIKLIKRGSERLRRPFTLPEIKRLLASADDEWRSLILFGLYTGQRLGDLAVLTWANVDLQRDEMRLATRKTGRRQIIPLAPALRRHVEGLPVSDDPRQALHPRAFASVQRSGKVGTLSRQFYELMVEAGMARPKKHRAVDSSTGRDGRHQMSEISFHALRHTATSLMKNAGISSATVQDIIGHESAAISANYTHIDEETKRSALSAIPDVLS